MVESSVAIFKILFFVQYIGLGRVGWVEYKLKLSRVFILAHYSIGSWCGVFYLQKEMFNCIWGSVVYKKSLRKQTRINLITSITGNIII